jgi:hypothetical protein
MGKSWGGRAGQERLVMCWWGRERAGLRGKVQMTKGDLSRDLKAVEGCGGVRGNLRWGVQCRERRAVLCGLAGTGVRVA